MNLICIFCSFSACIYTHIFTKILYNNNDELQELKKQLYKAREQINNYKESGAIEKIKINVKTFPNETIGLKSLMYHSVLVTPEEAEKIKVEKKLK